jgi:hypothetical protein
MRELLTETEVHQAEHGLAAERDADLDTLLNETVPLRQMLQDLEREHHQMLAEIASEKMRADLSFRQTMTRWANRAFSRG